MVQSSDGLMGIPPSLSSLPHPCLMKELRTTTPVGSLNLGLKWKAMSFGEVEESCFSSKLYMFRANRSEGGVLTSTNTPLPGWQSGIFYIGIHIHTRWFILHTYIL